MPAELALQKADTHLCVALVRKVRIRLHPSMESNWGIGNRNLCGLLSYQEERPLFFLIYVANYRILVIFAYFCKQKSKYDEENSFLFILSFEYNFDVGTRFE